ncbi:unnamed protein product [Amaranthus hypochondriacus]
MSKPLFNLFLLFSILSLTTANHHHPPPKKPTNFIYSSCLTTQYPPLCYHTLSSFDTKIGQSHRQLALTALAISLSKARSTSKFISQIKKIKGITQNELKGIKDCIDTMNNSVDQLEQSFEELANIGHTNGDDFMWHMSNVQTWVSAALTEQSTCFDGLNDGKIHPNGAKIKSSVQISVNSVSQVTSNALALVNRYVTRYNNGHAHRGKNHP